MSVLAGVLIYLAAADLRDYQVLVILLMAVVIVHRVHRVHKSGVSTKAVPAKYIVLPIVVLIPLYFLLVIAAQYLTPMLGVTLAALLAGTTLAAIVYMLSIFERSKPVVE